MRRLLLPFSWLYGGIIRLRNAAFDAGVLKSTGFEFPVIVVGNLSVGGTGKSPFVAEICRRAISAGKVVWVFARGVGGASESSGLWIAPSNEQVSASQVGDEAASLRRSVPGVGIGVGKNRSEVFRQALGLEKNWPDLIVLDDGGEQHWIEKSIEFWMLRGGRRFGRAWFRRFPWDLMSNSKCTRQIRVWSKGAQAPRGGHDLALSWKTVCRAPVGVIVAAIAHPDDLVHSVEMAGARVVDVLRLADHSSLENLEVERFIRFYFSEGSTSGRELVLWLSSKDRVKWDELVSKQTDWTIGVPIEELGYGFHVTEGSDLWEALWFNGS